MIALRPHRVLCLVAYRGCERDDPWSANVAAIAVGRLAAPGGRDERIRITTSADVFCAPCPKRRGADCAIASWIVPLDARHAAALGLGDGDITSWGALVDRARDVAPDHLDHLCAGCPFLPDGSCKAALHALRGEGVGRVSEPA